MRLVNYQRIIERSFELHPEQPVLVRSWLQVVLVSIVTHDDAWVSQASDSKVHTQLKATSPPQLQKPDVTLSKLEMMVLDLDAVLFWPVKFVPLLIPCLRTQIVKLRIALEIVGVIVCHKWRVIRPVVVVEQVLIHHGRRLVEGYELLDEQLGYHQVGIDMAT